MLGIVILGILSDTHGRAQIAAIAVQRLIDHGARYLVHCGDVGSRGVLDALAGGDPPAAVVWGNTDHDRERLADYATHLGIRHDHPALRLELAGKRIVVTHGDNGRALADVFRRPGEADYLLVGHTHAAADDNHHGVRVINPGALYRALHKTVATLDLATGELRWIRIDDLPHE